MIGGSHSEGVVPIKNGYCRRMLLRSLIHSKNGYYNIVGLSNSLFKVISLIYLAIFFTI
ncbi:hypothetical protein Phpb_02546 [Photorhabdus namnaonensis]|uniref:Uncharacterized protein n=1 Tax=Photorhabdus namnaonensis TaxID=1851568 RepID=A0A1B8YGF3_9GAMM|nr:hypothetical protein Phpb_02546 [Photorhabdus namnaonensis]